MEFADVHAACGETRRGAHNDADRTLAQCWEVTSRPVWRFVAKVCGPVVGQSLSICPSRVLGYMALSGPLDVRDGGAMSSASDSGALFRGKGAANR